MAAQEDAEQYKINRRPKDDTEDDLARYKQRAEAAEEQLKTMKQRLDAYESKSELIMGASRYQMTISNE